MCIYVFSAYCIVCKCICKWISDWIISIYCCCCMWLLLVPWFESTQLNRHILRCNEEHNFEFIVHITLVSHSMWMPHWYVSFACITTKLNSHSINRTQTHTIALHSAFRFVQFQFIPFHFFCFCCRCLVSFSFFFWLQIKRRSFSSNLHCNANSRLNLLLGLLVRLANQSMNQSARLAD